MHRRALLCGAGASLLTACAAPESVWAPDEVVSTRSYRGSGPKHVILFTMKSTSSDNGAHTGLLIDASQRVIFDPAGTFNHPYIPERNDVLFGASPLVEEFYTSYHARVTYYVITQKKFVAPDVAETILQRAMVAGPVPSANCTRATSGLLAGLPGFESIRQMWFPDGLHDAFARLPGVETREYRETDSDDKMLAIQQFNMQQAAVLNRQQLGQ